MKTLDLPRRKLTSCLPTTPIKEVTYVRDRSIPIIIFCMAISMFSLIFLSFLKSTTILIGVIGIAEALTTLYVIRYHRSAVHTSNQKIDQVLAEERRKLEHYEHTLLVENRQSLIAAEIKRLPTGWDVRYVTDCDVKSIQIKSEQATCVWTDGCEGIVFHDGYFHPCCHGEWYPGERFTLHIHNTKRGDLN
jgi:hypothetical protein